MTGRLGELLKVAEIPESAAAQEATVAAARAALPTDPASVASSVADAPDTSRKRPRGRHRGTFALAGVTVLLGAALLTPAGQAALGDAADLIGQIGGEPASDGDAGLESTVPPGQPGSPTVVDNGKAPDGSRYEWVAYRRTEELPPGVAPQSKRRAMDTFCVRFAWADAPRRESTGGCGSLGGWSPGVIHMTGRLARLAEAGGQRDYMMIGDVDPRVGRLEMVYRRPGGGRVELPVDLGRVDGKLLRRAGGDKPFTVLTAFIPGELVDADRLDDRYKLMSLGVVDPTSPMPLPYSSAYKRCVRRHGGFYERGWVDVILYDRQDRRIATLPTRTSRPRVAACKETQTMSDGGLVPGPKIVKTPTYERLQRAFPPQHPPMFR
jgi:hypothetical protein